MWKSASCRRRCRRIRRIIRTIRRSTSARPPTPDNRIRRRITRSGANWFINGPNIAWKNTAAAEVEKWYWEVWNEPNISYWHGTRADYFKLYDYAVDGVRRALPTARVGGPETAGGPGGGFLREFLEHCARGTNYVTGKIGSPLDFISFHAKGSPVFTNGHVRMGMANQFSDINGAFAVIASFPEFKKLPIVIGESDPEGCAACREPRDAYRNGTMYSSYTAASFPREFELAEKHGVNLEGALTWAFEFENQPPFAGFRQLASDGIDLPVLNVFRMFGKMSGQRVAVDSSAGLDAQTILQIRRARPSRCFRACEPRQKQTLRAGLALSRRRCARPGRGGGPCAGQSAVRKAATRSLTQYRIDADHSNSYAAWLRMGSPQPLSDEQYPELEKAGQLAMLGQPKSLRVRTATPQ